ncbi:MAG: hypothetical protein WCF20_11340 [Methylovirgula sp.]
MISHTTPDFWACFSRLPESVQARAKAAFILWRNNPQHPSLHFKPVASAGEDVWSVRIGIRWRALGVRERDEMIWFWIGSHADYDQLIG